MADLKLAKEHPIAEALKLIAPVIGANFVLRSVRDSELSYDKYPLVDYVIHHEDKATYDSARNNWRIRLVVQLEYMLEETSLEHCVGTTADELEESLIVQALQFDWTTKLRAILQILIAPHTLGEKLQKHDFSWTKHDFKLDHVIRSWYFRDKGDDKVTGAASLFVISLKQFNAAVCCTGSNLDKVKEMLTAGSISERLLAQEQQNPATETSEIITKDDL